MTCRNILNKVGKVAFFGLKIFLKKENNFFFFFYRFYSLMSELDCLVFTVVVEQHTPPDCVELHLHRSIAISIRVNIGAEGGREGI